MATGADPKKTYDNLDDLLKCAICLETLKEPKYLPCLHTFCKSCIHTYIDSIKEKKGEILCPICRKTLSSRDESDNTETIVNSLPENNFVLSLLNKQTIREQRLCDFCNTQGQHNEAVSWCGVCVEFYCEKCIQFHKFNKSLATHKVVSIKDVQNETVDLNETSFMFCDDHRESIVQVYCVDHKKACCTLCATLSHRKCDKVISIEEAAGGIKQKSEVTDLLFKLKEFEVLLTEVIKCRNENDETFDTESTNIETAVTKIIKEMKDHLDKIQNKILSELEATKKQTSMRVSDDINDFTSYKSAVTNWKNMLTGVVKHGSEQQCLVIQNKVAVKVEKLQDEIKDAMTRTRNVSARFESSSIVNEFNRQVSSIGQLNVDEFKLKYERGKLELLKTDFRKGEIKIVRTIEVTHSGRTCGVFLEGHLIFTACNAGKIVKFKHDGELLYIGELTVPSQPTDLCHMSATCVVVASHANILYTMDCKDMTLLKTINLIDVPVYGICVLENSNQFLVGSHNVLSWIDQSSKTKHKSVKTAGYSYYVSTSGHNDYLYGDGDNSVSYVVNGTKKFTYTTNQLSYPTGNAMDYEENFYIAGCTSSNIHQITSKGQLIRIIPSSAVGVKRPWSIRFEKGTNRFLVTCNDTGNASLCCID